MNDAKQVRQPFYQGLYFQVIVAILLGVALGAADPSAAEKMKPLGDGFIKLIRMMIGPVIADAVGSGNGPCGRDHASARRRPFYVGDAIAD